MGKINETYDSSEDEDSCEFTCCDCNERLADNFMGYYSTERCIGCEERLIDIGASIPDEKDDLRADWLYCCMFRRFDGSLAEHRKQVKWKK